MDDNRLAAATPTGAAHAPAGHPRFPLLFSPIAIGPVTLPNRIVNPAHTTGYARDGMFTEQLLAYHGERARGGAGLIVTQPNYVTGDYGGVKSVDDRIVGWYERLVSEVRPHGTKVFAQLSHPGRQGTYTGQGAQVHLAPSPVPGRPMGQEWRIPKAMSAADIADVVTAFADAARRCLRGGLDGIELHLAHGNLVDQFISPETNLRTDDWGGPLLNRLRLAFEILHAVRDVVGRDIAVGARITGGDLASAGAVPVTTASDATGLDRLEAAGHLGASGLVDYLSVSVGHYSDALATARNLPDMSFPPAVWKRYAREIRHIVDVPVAVVGRVNHPAVAEELLAEGSCDLVAMARALIADPHLPRKAFEGKVDRIRPCVGAVEACWGRVFRGLDMGCVHNPTVGRELRWTDDLPLTTQPQRIVVVGGGPAGLECARVAAARGHDVVLLEQQPRLGGQILLAARAPHREELRGIVEWLTSECELAGVDVRLGVAATSEVVLTEQPDIIVVATGAREGRLPGPVTGAVPVLGAWDVLRGADVPPRVVVVDQDGRRPGLSVAELLASTGHEVDVVTPMTYPGQSIEPFGWRTAYERLLGLGVRFHPLTEVVAVADGRVETVHTLTGARSVIAGAGAVVTSLLPVAADALYSELRDCTATEIHLVGDAATPRGIEEATHEGHAVARSI